MADKTPPSAQPLAAAQELLSRLWSQRERLLKQPPSPHRRAPLGHFVPPLEVLESGVRLSESLLWGLHEHFFRREGITAWETIPFYITNNTFIAATYAELLVAWLLDHHASIRREEPLYIVEMAAGTAAFGYYLVRELAARM